MGFLCVISLHLCNCRVIETLLCVVTSAALEVFFLIVLVLFIKTVSIPFARFFQNGRFEKRKHHPVVKGLLFLVYRILWLHTRKIVYNYCHNRKLADFSETPPYVPELFVDIGCGVFAIILGFLPRKYILLDVFR